MSLTKTVTVAAPLDRVWGLWTSAEGVTSIGPDEAWIEARAGGAYEWYFAPGPAGLRGSEGCRVLVVVPHRWLAFSWNAPPSIPALRSLGPITQVALEFEPSGEGTRLTLRHLIEGEGPDWEAYAAYFDRAWDRVLANVTRRAGGTPS